VSLTTRKNQAQAQASAGLDLARKTATQVTPLAKNASTTATQSLQSAREWAAPRVGQGVHHARGWAAPRIEQAGRALTETVAPKVSEVLTDTVAPKVSGMLTDTVAPKVSGMLTETAHRIEPSGQAGQRRRWPRLLAGLAIVAAAGGAIGVILRRRSAKLTEDLLADDEVIIQPVPEAREDQDGEPSLADVEAGSNGRVR
jgi:hypothetical protein